MYSQLSKKYFLKTIESNIFFVSIKLNNNLKNSRYLDIINLFSTFT